MSKAHSLTLFVKDNDWIRTRVLWYQNRPPSQLRHKHCQETYIVKMKIMSKTLQIILQKLPGVVAYVDHKDIPGHNNWSFFEVPEEIFSSGRIHFAGQCTSMISSKSVFCLNTFIIKQFDPLSIPMSIWILKLPTPHSGMAF